MEDQESNLIDEEQMKKGRKKERERENVLLKRSPPKKSFPSLGDSPFFSSVVLLAHSFAFLAVVLVRDVDWTLTNDVRVCRHP